MTNAKPRVAKNFGRRDVRSAFLAGHSVDEVKQFRDKAAALQTYARMANDHDAERKLGEIRVRAERMAGEILKALEKNKGGQPSRNRSSNTAGSPTLAEHGVTKDKSSQWQRLADVPEEIFEARLANPYGIPTATEIVTLGETAKAPKPASAVTPIDRQALWLWGRLLDFERRWGDSAAISFWPGILRRSLRPQISVAGDNPQSPAPRSRARSSPRSRARERSQTRSCQRRPKRS